MYTPPGGVKRNLLDDVFDANFFDYSVNQQVFKDIFDVNG